jgi:hypothetical protein
MLPTYHRLHQDIVFKMVLLNEFHPKLLHDLFTFLSFFLSFFVLILFLSVFYDCSFPSYIPYTGFMRQKQTIKYDHEVQYLAVSTPIFLSADV